MSSFHALRYLAGTAICCLLWCASALGQSPFVRGDINCDGTIDNDDVAALQNRIFNGMSIPCDDAGDVNDDGNLNTIDLTYLSNYVNSGGPPPAAPFPLCGYDPTPDNLTCLSSCCGSARDHYQAWRLQPQTFGAHVTIQDQFMFDSQVALMGIEYLSNPAQKDTFLITRPDDHHTWYRADGRDTLLTVEFYNQFGQDTVEIDTLMYLLVPTQKFPHPPPSPALDHYKAYRIRNPQTFIRPTQIMDQFLPTNFTTDQLTPRYFLTPASKNGEVVTDTVTHYVAYDIFPNANVATSRQTQDQFGPHLLQTTNSQMLLVPTYKLSFHPPGGDTLKNHYKTWRVNPLQPFSGLAVVEDQFMTDQMFLGDIEFLSNPARKDTSLIKRPLDHLNWYRATGQQTVVLRVEYENQFHKDTIIIDTATHLLVPCQKEPHAPPDSLLGHYKAYRIRNGATYIKAGNPVFAQDQFDQVPEVFDSLVAKYFLTPAKKNNEPQYGSDTHYVAYEIFPKTGQTVLPPRHTQDQFGGHDLQIVQSELLLVPSHKITWGPPEDTVKNHYKSWRLQPTPFPMTVQVVDQFMSEVVKLDSIEYLSNPTQKNNEPIVLPDDHLLWYGADGRDTCVQVIFSNQFGLDTLVVGTTTYLLLPAQKLPHPPPSTTLDHYKAYAVFRPQEFTRVNTLFDQFDANPFTQDRLKPLYLCLPASKNGEPIHDSVMHYMAYEFFPKQQLTTTRIVNDQFGQHDIVTLRSEILMVPTRKLDVKPYCPITKPGDANCDVVVNAADIITLVNYVFKSGLPPCPCPAAGDINCSGTVTSADIIALVNYVFKGGAPPCNPCLIIPSLWRCPC